MGLLADSVEDPRYAANMALAAGLLKGDFGGGLLGFNQALSGAKEQALKTGLLGAQIENYKSEAEARKLKSMQDQRQQDFLTGAVGQPGGGGGGGGGLIAQARELGIPENAIRADVTFNSGKGISDMLFKRGVPDMQVTNGYAYNKNNLNAGYLPQLNTSQDGKTSMVQIGQDGMPVVSSPQGAYNTFAGYQNIQEGTKANFDPVTVTPQGQNPQMTSRGALMRNPQMQGNMIPPAVQSERDAGRKMILQSELAKAQQELNRALGAGDQSAAARAQNDMAALQREMGGKTASVGMPLQSEEEKLRAIEGVKADADRNRNTSQKAEQARDMAGMVTRARTLLKNSPTGSGVGNLIDKGAALFGMTPPGADAATALETLAGAMTSNIPRMEGPQSNIDVQNYQIQAGRVGDRTLPAAQRLSALDEVERIREKYAHLNSPSAPSASGASGGFGVVPTQAPSAQGGAQAGAPKVSYRYTNGKLVKVD